MLATHCQLKTCYDVDCKTVRIFAYSSTREQSNKRSGMMLKTESARKTLTPCHALPISLLILRKKPTVLQSSYDVTVSYLSNSGWLTWSFLFRDSFVTFENCVSKIK